MIRRSVLALLASTALLPIAGALAQTKQLSPAETQLINDISAYNSTIHTMIGRFMQIDTKGQKIEGTFYLERPNKIRFRYNPPSREEIISVGRGFYVINRKDLTSYAYPQDKVPLREFLQDKIDLLSGKVVDVVKSKTYITITLSDDTPAGTVEVSLVFDIASKDLSQWVLREPSGAETTFSLYDVQKNVPIPKSYFYIDPTYKPIQQ
jgi:outer membrane lipoprotein-sorting protein